MLPLLVNFRTAVIITHLLCSRDGKVDNTDSRSSPEKLLPSLAAVFGYTFYIGGYSVGPFFTFQRYRTFVNGTLYGPAQDTGRAAAFVRRLAAAIVYVALANTMTAMFPAAVMYTEEFQQVCRWVVGFHITNPNQCAESLHRRRATEMRCRHSQSGPLAA